METLKTRDQIPQEGTWNLTTIFKNDQAWENAFAALSNSIPAIKTYQGKLGESPETLLACLNTWYGLGSEGAKLLLYASMKKDQDTTNSLYVGMADRANTIYAKIQTEASYITPEILLLGQDTCNRYVNDCPRLKPYAQDLHDIHRKKAHILSTEMEALLTRTQEIGQGAHQIYNAFNDADVTFEKALDSQGEAHEITKASYGDIIDRSDRVLRKNAQAAILAPYKAYQHTLSEAYNYTVKQNIIVAEVKHFGSALEAALFDWNIPTDIYTNLIATITESLPLFHRYLELRKKCLGYDTLQAWDLSVPLVENANTAMSWGDAKANVLDSVAVLGAEYQAAMKEGFDNRWIDRYENKGKKGGAYAWGVHGLPHPFVLMNFNHTVDSMFTLAHEMGHALHYHYTHTNQPLPTGDYSIFLAEIASTVNEALLTEHMLGKTTDKTTYNYLLSYSIEQFVSTFFRQAQLAEFEMCAHQMAEAGKPLNATTLGQLYHSVWSKYYGSVVEAGDTSTYGWLRISHFHRPFYVYQYATGFAASIALSKKIREEGAPGVDKYLQLLKSGASDYSIALLQTAGVDMTTPAPIQEALAVFGSLLDRFEKANF